MTNKIELIPAQNIDIINRLQKIHAELISRDEDKKRIISDVISSDQDKQLAKDCLKQLFVVKHLV